MTYFNHFIMYVGGVIFGFGLAFSGAAVPEVVLSFLNLEDLGLVFVIGVAFLVVLFTIQVVPKLLNTPPFGERFDGHDGFPVTKKSIVGAIIFGIGWGISGICPATSFAAVGMGNWPVIVGIIGMFFGALVYGSLRSRQAKEE